MINDNEIQEMITASFLGKGELTKRQSEYYAAVATRIALLQLRYFIMAMTILTIGGTIILTYLILTAILWRVL